MSTPKRPPMDPRLLRTAILVAASSSKPIAPAVGAPTNYLLDGSGNVLTDAGGNRLRSA